MATFRVTFGPVVTTGSTNGDAKGKFVSQVKCPFCSVSFSSEKKPDQKRSVPHLESAVRSMAKKHYDKKHKEK